MKIVPFNQIGYMYVDIKENLEGFRPHQEDLRSVSILQDDTVFHLVIGPEYPARMVTDSKIPGISKEIRQDVGFESVGRFVLAVINTTMPYQMAAGLLPISCLAGWDLREKGWPFLLNILLSQGEPVPEVLKTDPMVRYNTVDGIIGINYIYSQGYYPKGYRHSLETALRDWRIEIPTAGSELDIISSKLVGMKTVLEKYYA